MHESQLIEIVKTRIGAATDADAERAIEAVLTTLGERMPEADVRVVAEELPPRFAPAFQLRSHDPGMSLEEFYARVSRRAGLSHGFAREHVQAVCRTLYALLNPRAQPCIDVWPELVRPSLADRLPPVVPTHGRTLATARPGSRHPLSEAGPPDRTQLHSVARTDNPHRDRKLSSGAPMLGETLAEARPPKR